MKRTPIKKRGKRYFEWQKAKAILKEKYQSLEITRCEICGSEFGLSFHHRHYRGFYYTRPGLDSLEETLLTCQDCHGKLQGDKNLSDKTFETLRQIKNDI